MRTNLLTSDAFNAFFSPPMRNVTVEAEANVDIWPYVEAVPVEHLRGTELGDVEYVYRDQQERFDLVNIGTDNCQVFLVIVVDLERNEIRGHHLLDLPSLYGIDDHMLDG